jgi:hypothetical protein
MFEATTGLSVRLALKHFANLAESPLLPAIGDGFDPLNIASAFARAYFFGNAGGLARDAFDNLYAIGGDMRTEYRLIKPRILDFVHRRPRMTTEVDTLVAHMSKFGYGRDELTKALADLLFPARPLLWCQDALEIPPLTSHAAIAATPLGEGYIDTLFGELYYDEVCIASGPTARVDIHDLFDFHRDLWEQEKKEIKAVVTGPGKEHYRSVYPNDRIALSVLHARNMIKGIKKRRISERPAGFDPQRDEFLADEVRSLLSAGWRKHVGKGQ